MTKRYIIPALFLLSTFSLKAQFTEAIEDNSFFIEEAYNQEEGVVQHIFTGSGVSDALFTEANFTQEWPAFGQTHQVSITIPYLYSSTLDGIGDFLLNYRYQLTNENGLAVSPRFSLIIPTGDDAKGLGDGVVGVQLNLPVSKRWHDEFITHFNAGLTMLPNVYNGTRRETQTEYFLGASGIYLANKNFNLMAEILYTVQNGSDELIFNPGVRFAIDIGNLQIVPGLAFPIIYTSGRQESGMFLYLSFEHPF
ncbi:MAG: transporter [Bacteroidota bacterium]